MGLEPVDEVFDRLGFGRDQFRSVVIIGIVNSIEPLMMTLFSIIGAELRCEWLLTSHQVGLMSTAHVSGIAVGNLVCGLLSVKLDRQMVFCVAFATAVYFLLLVTFVPSYSWLIFLLVACGFFVGGVVPAGLATVAEINTSTSKARGTVLMFVFWALGTLAMGVVPLITRVHWTILVLITTIIYACAIGLLRYLPYSPRQLLYRGEHHRANKIIAEMAERNGKSELLSALLPVQINYQSSRTEIGRLFNKKKLGITALLLFMWTLTFFNLYGAVIMSTHLPKHYRGCVQVSIEEPSIYFYIPEKECCSGIDTQGFLIITLVAVGELLGLAFSVLTLDHAGRKCTIFVLSLVGGFSYVCLSVCSDVIVTTVFMVTSRAAGIGILAALVVYTGELYPTAIVTMAMGVMSCAGHIGAAISPFFGASVIKRMHPLAAMSTYSGVYLIIAVVSLLLPVETLTNAKRQSDPEQYDFRWLPEGEAETVHLIGNY